jgi:hypothetical protein
MTVRRLAAGGSHRWRSSPDHCVQQNRSPSDRFPESPGQFLAPCGGVGNTDETGVGEMLVGVMRVVGVVGVVGVMRVVGLRTLLHHHFCDSKPTQ